MRKILKKFTKEHFEIKDNVIDKTLGEYIKLKHFSTRRRLHFTIDDMVSFFSMHFTHNNREKAKRMLEKHNN